MIDMIFWITLIAITLVFIIHEETGKKKIECSKCRRFAYAILSLKTGGRKGWIKTEGWKESFPNTFCPECAEVTG